MKKDDTRKKEKAIEKKLSDNNKESLKADMLPQLSFTEKIGLVKAIAIEVITRPAHRYRKIQDLITLCKDNGSVDVVLKAVGSLCEVFCEIIPSYRIRE